MVARQLLRGAVALLRPRPGAQAAADVAAPPAEPAAPTDPWRALPGSVIELGASGFQIQLDTSPNRPLYTLRAPEGFLYGWGNDLEGIKRLGEKYAAERAQFVCKPIEVKW